MGRRDASILTPQRLIGSNSQISARTQDPEKVSQARKIVSEHARIVFSQVDADQVMNRHRGISHQVWLSTARNVVMS